MACFLLIFHISLAVVAIITFVKGKLTISHRWVATGTPAYFAAIVLLLPFPFTVAVVVALTAIFMQAQFWGGGDFERWSDSHGFAFVILTLGITAVCLSLAFLIAMIWARDPSDVESEERRREEEEDWDDEDWDTRP